MKKKAISAALASVLALSLFSACGASSEPQNIADVTSSEETTSSSEAAQEDPSAEPAAQELTFVLNNTPDGLDPGVTNNSFAQYVIINCFEGLVTYDRKLKKDPFYVYKAYWTDEPMVHISGSRFVDRAPGERNITVYTNCPAVTLSVNGAAVATRDAVDHCVVFKDVPLADGANTVTAAAGDVSDTAAFNAVAEHNYAYDLPEGNDAANWFDDPKAREARKPLNYPEGFYSIKDKVVDLMANSETAAVIKDVIDTFAHSSMMSMMNSDKDDNSDGGIMGTMRLADMMKMAGRSFSADVKRQVNEALTKIKKG